MATRRVAFCAILRHFYFLVVFLGLFISKNVRLLKNGAILGHFVRFLWGLPAFCGCCYPLPALFCVISAAAGVIPFPSVKIFCSFSGVRSAADSGGFGFLLVMWRKCLTRAGVLWYCVSDGGMAMARAGAQVFGSERANCGRGRVFGDSAGVGR